MAPLAPMPALIIGLVAGAFCYWTVTRVKAIFGYDDALDAFGVHGAGGTIGALLFKFKTVGLLLLTKGKLVLLGLTKLNYNACLYGDGEPVTLKFADAVGEILTAGPVTDVPLPFRLYI